MCICHNVRVGICSHDSMWIEFLIFCFTECFEMVGNDC